MDVSDCKLIAEIGCVHAGSVTRAIKLAHMAAESGADVIKFQKRNPHISTPENIKNQSHPNPEFSYGKTYLDHRINLELSIDDHFLIKKVCEDAGSQYGCSVWDIDSAKEIISINPFLLKIPSAHNSNFELINYCLENWEGDLHISLGMTNRADREIIFNELEKNKERIVLYHCVSEYPCPFERMFLYGISEIRDAGFRAAFSNHGYGIACDIAAMMLGAIFDERHFVDDRTFRHTDAAASLEPDGFKKLKRDVLAVKAALQPRFDMTEEELKQSRKLKIDE